MKIRNVVRTIDRGAFGSVELVELEDGTICARKVFAPAFAVANSSDAQKLKTRFQREVSLQSTLPADLFVPILGHDLNDDPPWFLMPLCERTLQQEMDAHAKVSSIPAAALLNVLDSLHYLELHTLVHRDLKPSNVLLHDGRWKLADFGLVSIPSGDATRLTSTLSAWGTEAYCAPEQRINFSLCSWQADQYSFGCILHDIAGTARIPYHTHTASGRLGKIIERCTAQDTRQRFTNVEGLRTALLAIVEGPPDSDIDPDALDLAIALSNTDTMSALQIANLRAFLSSWNSYTTVHENDAWAIFSAISDENLEAMKHRPRSPFDSLVREYLRWSERTFSPIFRNVVFARLERLLVLSTISHKPYVAIAAARLAAHHRDTALCLRVVKMCGPELGDDIARRLARDIHAGRAGEPFFQCAESVGQDRHAYHASVAQSLKSYVRIEE